MFRQVPPKVLFFFDDSDLQAQLRSANGADISAGAGADDDEIIHGSLVRTHDCINASRSSLLNINIEQQPRRVFKRLFDADEEGHRLLAIDDAMIVRQGEIHHRADFDLAADRDPAGPRSCASRESPTVVH